MGIRCVSVQVVLANLRGRRIRRAACRKNRVVGGMAPTMEIILAANPTASTTPTVGSEGKESPAPGAGVAATHGWLGVGVHGIAVGATVAVAIAVGVGAENRLVT